MPSTPAKLPNNSLTVLYLNKQEFEAKLVYAPHACLTDVLLDCLHLKGDEVVSVHEFRL
jgi:hypothetical protein